MIAKNKSIEPSENQNCPERNNNAAIAAMTAAVQYDMRLNHYRYMWFSYNT